MSTTIYIIRHGESEANERDLFLGHGDLELTQRGISQARMAADYLNTHVGRPDAIYASDLKRAYRTAQATAEHFDMPITKDPNLREIDAGQWDFVPFSHLQKQFPETYSLWMKDIGNSRCDGGESVAQLQRRVVGAITDIAKKHENSTLFVFSHGTPIRVFAAHCLASRITDVPWATNASVTQVIYNDDAFRLVEYGRNDFMQGLITALPNNV